MERYDKIILLADVHYGVHVSSLEWLENITNYFQNFFIPFLKKERTENTCIVIMGDYFEDRQSLDINIMVHAIENMKELASYVPVYMMIGNHDLYKKSGLDRNSLACLEDIPNVHVIGVEDEGVKTIETVNGKYITMISWIEDHVKESALIHKYKKSSSVILLHTELCGMLYDNGREIKEGTVVNPEGVKILSGHIHRRQSNKEGTMMYVGSPYHTERSDIGDQKGIYTLYAEDDELKIKFTPNAYSPVYMKVTLSLDENNSWIINRPFTDITNNYVDIELTEDVNNMINSNKVAEELYKYKPKSLTFRPISKNIIVDTNNVEYTENTGIITVFENTVQKLSLSEKQIDKIMKLNNNYIKTASEELGIQI